MLAVAPTPAMAAGLSKTQIAAAQRRAGKQRGIPTLAAQLQAALRRPQLRQPWLVEDAMGAQALALLASLNAECDGGADWRELSDALPYVRAWVVTSLSARRFPTDPGRAAVISSSSGMRRRTPRGHAGSDAGRLTGNATRASRRS